MRLEKRRGEVDPRAPPRTVIATGKRGDKEGETRKLSLGEEKPRKVADVRLNEKVTILVIPREKGVEEGDSFRPTKKLQRSPTIGGRAQVEMVDESGGSYSVRDSDFTTPVIPRKRPPVQLVRKVVNRNTKRKRIRVTTASELEDSTREDTQSSDGEEEEDVLISRAELKGLTRALAGAVQMLGMAVRKNWPRTTTRASGGWGT